jgi:hypothetical protein
VYEINNPKPEDPVLVTTNFSITYFSVANEVESSGLPAWLVVTDAEGMSVLTAWAAGKFDAERIAKAIKTFNVADKVSHKRAVIPGHVAVLSGELEEELPGWEIRVGPRERDLPAFMKQVSGGSVTTYRPIWIGCQGNGDVPSELWLNIRSSLTLLVPVFVPARCWSKPRERRSIFSSPVEDRDAAGGVRYRSLRKRVHAAPCLSATMWRATACQSVVESAVSVIVPPQEKIDGG